MSTDRDRYKMLYSCTGDYCRLLLSCLSVRLSLACFYVRVFFCAVFVVIRVPLQFNPLEFRGNYIFIFYSPLHGSNGMRKIRNNYIQIYTNRKII